MFQLPIYISTEFYELQCRITAVTIVFTGSLALTKLRKEVACLWSQPREVKQYVTTLPASLGLNRSLLHNVMYS
jgi:hypothetical protein